jgi:hypothetical protein
MTSKRVQRLFLGKEDVQIEVQYNSLYIYNLGRWQHIILVVKLFSKTSHINLCYTLRAALNQPF